MGEETHSLMYPFKIRMSSYEDLNFHSITVRYDSFAKYFSEWLGLYTVLLNIISNHKFKVHNMEYPEKNVSSETAFFYRELVFDTKEQIINNNLKQKNNGRKDRKTKRLL